MNNAWFIEDGKLYPVNTDNIEKLLSPMVYTIKKTLSGFCLNPQEEKLTLPEKLYGIEQEFISHVLKTWHATSQNLGVSLNGIQGAGKSITAKQIANQVGLPIVLVEEDLGVGMVNFLAEISQDIVVFCDEYEKVFKPEKEDDYNEKQDNSTLLTIMDGVRGNASRKLFLLTTNQNTIHPAMKQRPSRLRYTKEFGNLSRPVIETIVDDMLLWPELREVTVQFISRLALITVDIVKSVTEEVNIHRQDPEVFGSFFNVKKQTPLYDVILLNGENGEPETIGFGVELQIGPDELGEDYSIASRRRNYGTVVEVLDNGEYLCQLTGTSRIPALKDKKPYDDRYTLRLEAVEQFHSAFSMHHAF